MHFIQETFNMQRLGKGKISPLFPSGVSLDLPDMHRPQGLESKHSAEPVRINPCLWDWGV